MWAWWNAAFWEADWAAAFEVDGGDGRADGHAARRSCQHTHHRDAAGDAAQDRFDGTGRGQVNADGLLQFLDPGTELDQFETDGVELGGSPAGALGNGLLEGPDQPVSAGMQKQAELVGGRGGA